MPCMPLPAFVSGVRHKVEGETVISICGADQKTYIYVLCGRDEHLYALADAKKIVKLLNEEKTHV